MKKLFIIAALLVVTAVPSMAQLTVIDPASIRQQVQQLLQMQKQLVQLQQMYSVYQQQYVLLNSEAQSLQGLQNRYRYTFANWQQFAAGNQYGNTGTWSNSINSGQPAAIQTAYRQLVGTVQPADVTITPQAQQDWRQQYGLLQLQDGSIMNAMKAAGDVRTNVQNNARTLSQLETDATDPNLQSSKALQQKTLMAILLTIRTLQDTNRMIEASMNLQIQREAQQRWERGRELNAGAASRQATQ
jgi:hypothetical protein